ncbi:hypothetical protein AB0C52_18150 [Streptomyces sp. NPDC048717]|uniref:hypothetical protein n=1 Tax=Streptomyces sp. NPDC048717 TaxID=3154928 RepID=UPI0034295731
MRRRRTGRRGAASGLIALAAATLLAGCGIRTTSIPVDAGAAPSRVPCEAAAGGTTESGTLTEGGSAGSGSGSDSGAGSGADSGTDSGADSGSRSGAGGTRSEGIAPGPRGVPLRVYLLCGAQLERVERGSSLPEEKASDDPVRTAAALLAQLTSEPSEGERQAGFSSAAQGALTLSGPRRGDPADTLRLSRQPEDLPAAALAQLVCTFAESAAGAGGDTVVLGGPGPYEPRRYRCTEQLRERPESPVPSSRP